MKVKKNEVNFKVWRKYPSRRQSDTKSSPCFRTGEDKKLLHYDTLEFNLCKHFFPSKWKKNATIKVGFIISHILQAIFCIQGHITHFIDHLQTNPHNLAMAKHW